MRTEKQKNLRKVKYQRVLEVTGSVKEARRARDLGLKTIFKDYGVNISKRQTKPRQVSKATIQRRKREAIKAKQLIGAGVKTNEAKQISKRSKIFIKNYIEGLYNPKRVELNKTFFDTTNRILKRYTKKSEMDRVDQWKDWARKDNEYPQSIERTAIKINRSQGFQDDAAYGWAVVNMVYVKNITIEEAIEAHTPYYNYGGEIYERVELISG